MTAVGKDGARGLARGPGRIERVTGHKEIALDVDEPHPASFATIRPRLRNILGARL